MDYNLDNNWHAIGMLESEKALHGDDSMNGTIDLDRYYLKGAVGIVMVMAGSRAYKSPMAIIIPGTTKGLSARSMRPMKLRHLLPFTKKESTNSL